MNTIDKIKEQINTREITFFQSYEILDNYNVKNINHLTCAIIANYLFEKYYALILKLYFSDIYISRHQTKNI